MAGGLKDRILDDTKAAMKSGDKLRLAVLRMIKSEIQRAEVALRVDRGRDYALSDAEVVEVVARAAKQRRESVDSFRAGGRDDLADREERELAVVEEYLPRQMDRDEILKLIDEAIAETGAASSKDVGAVMKQVAPRTKGRADGKEVNRLVRERLSGG